MIWKVTIKNLPAYEFEGDRADAIQWIVFFLPAIKDRINLDEFDKESTVAIEVDDYEVKFTNLDFSSQNEAEVAEPLKTRSSDPSVESTSGKLSETESGFPQQPKTSSRRGRPTSDTPSST